MQEQSEKGILETVSSSANNIYAITRYQGCLSQNGGRENLKIPPDFSRRSQKNAS